MRSSLPPLTHSSRIQSLAEALAAIAVHFTRCIALAAPKGMAHVSLVDCKAGAMHEKIRLWNAGIRNDFHF